MAARGVGASLQRMLDRLSRPRFARLSHRVSVSGIERLSGSPPVFLSTSYLDRVGRLRVERPRLERLRLAPRRPFRFLSHARPAQFATRLRAGLGSRTFIRAELRPRQPGGRQFEYAVAGFAGLVLAILIVCPLLALFAGSLRGTSGLTLANVGAVLAQWPYLGALVNTLVLGIAAAVLSLAIGVALAWAVARAQVPGNKLIHIAALACLLSPSFFTAIAFARLFNPDTGSINVFLRAIGMSVLTFNVFSMTGLVLVTVLHTYAFVYFFTWSALRAIDPSYERAGKQLGGGQLEIFTSITAPLIGSSILAGTLLAFVTAISLFAPQAVIGLPGHVVTLPTRIYLLWGQTEYGLASAASLMLIAVALAAVVPARSLMARRSPAKRRAVERTSDPLPSGAAQWVLSGLGMLMLFLGVVCPVLTLIVVSLSGPDVATGLTWANYRFILLEDNVSGHAVLNSLVLGAVAAALAVALGAAVGWIEGRTHLPERRLLADTAFVAIGIPGTALAVGLIQLWSAVSPVLPGTLTLLMLAYVALFVPLGANAAIGALDRVDLSLERSARLLGASAWQTMREVRLPLLRPALAAAGLVVFAQVMQELGASILLFGRKSLTLPVVVFHLYESGKLEQAATLAVVALMLAGVSVWFAVRLCGPGVVRSFVGREGAA